MTLAIDVDKVAEVLLADGWHKVDSRNGVSSFDAYEFILEREKKDPIVLHGGGQGGVCSTGAAWQEKHNRVCCPLTAILAIRIRMKKAGSKKPIRAPGGVEGKGWEPK